jgi:2-dehydro-3-deoxyphosphogluconate aldolase/(4S)-4-hydroxy-2-oxoglutarate aldolase
MTSVTRVRDLLVAQRVVPVLRFGSAATTIRAIDCLREAGFGTFEITLTTPGAVELIAELHARLGATASVGAGTVTDLDAARRCVDAGAQFLVSPCVVPGLAALAHEAGRAALIGGFTPTEILAAHHEGADIVKVFPSSIGGPAYLGALHAVFPDVLLCPTGGVTLENVKSYFTAGAALVGIGNNLLDQAALAAGDLGSVIAGARRFLDPTVSSA